MSTIYALVVWACTCASLFLVIAWIRLERETRRRRKVLEVHARKLNQREVF